MDTRPPTVPELGVNAEVVWFYAPIFTRDQRVKLVGGVGATLWLTGLSGAGKSTTACGLEAEFMGRGVRAFRLDGDNLRTGINADLGFSHKDRTENIRRVAHIARLFADSGAIAIVCALSPLREDRDSAQRLHVEDPAGPLPFFEIHISTTLGCAKAETTRGLP